MTWLLCNYTANFIKCIIDPISLELIRDSYLTYLTWARLKPLPALSSAGNPVGTALEKKKKKVPHFLKWSTTGEDIVLKKKKKEEALGAFQTICRDLIGNSIIPNVGRKKITLCSENMQRHFLWTSAVSSVTESRESQSLWIVHLRRKADELFRTWCV